MAIIFTIFIILISLNDVLKSQTYEDASEDAVNKKIKILKEELLAQIKKEQIESVPGLFNEDDRSDELDPNVMYPDPELKYKGDKNMAPIMDSDKKKADYRPLRMKHPYTSSETVTPSTKEIKIKPLRSHKKKQKYHSPAVIPSEIFYRRNERDLNKPLKWAHCLVLLTPYLLEGKNLNPSDDYNIKHLSANDTLVLRLIHLLNIDTKQSTADEIHSVLWHISNTPIRLFQWTNAALRLLINEIITEKEQNFRTLKNGIKRLFAKWHLDITNTTNLLKQTKIFRPPCVKTTMISGSTKSSHGTRYTKSKAPKKSCPPSEEDRDSCEDD